MNKNFFQKLLICFSIAAPRWVLADDVVLFQPIQGGEKSNDTLKSIPPIAQWPEWCGVKIIIEKPSDAIRKTSVPGYYTLIDGQRLAGAYELNGTKLMWRNTILQSVPIDLENSKSIGALNAGKENIEKKDSVVLINNDRLDGFIESIDIDRGVGIETTTSSQTPQKKMIYIPIDRIVDISLVAKSKKPSGWRIWTNDGSVIDADSWIDDQNQCRLIKPHAAIERDSVLIPWKNILAIAPNTNGIEALSKCFVKTEADTQVQEQRLSQPVVILHTTPEAFDAIRMDLHGPGLFLFQTNRSAGTLLATISVPPQIQKNIGCRVTILSDEKVVWESFITPEFKRTSVRLQMNGGQILFRLDQSIHGAFGCAVRLDDAIIVSDTHEMSQPPNHLQPNAPTKSDL